MLDHVSIGVRDVKTAKRFYDAAPEAARLHLPERGRRLARLRQRCGSPLWIGAAERPVPADAKSGLHFCFAAPTRKAVDAFHAAALRAGGSDNGAPGLRADYGPGYTRRVRGRSRRLPHRGALRPRDGVTRRR